MRRDFAKSMNNQIFYFFYSFAHQNIFLDNFIIFCAVYLPYLVVILGGLFLLFHHEVFKADNSIEVLKQKYKEILMMFFSGVLAYVVAHLFKFILNTARPFVFLPNVISLFEKTGNAFPSGHAAFFMALGMTFYFLHKKVGYLFIIFALIISIARIVSGVHFPIDIVGGFVLGAIVSLVIEHFKSRFAYSIRKM